jgi:hypothetical protein
VQEVESVPSPPKQKPKQAKSSKSKRNKKKAAATAVVEDDTDGSEEEHASKAGVKKPVQHRLSASKRMALQEEEALPTSRSRKPTATFEPDMEASTRRGTPSKATSSQAPSALSSSKAAAPMPPASKQLGHGAAALPTAASAAAMASRVGGVAVGYGHDALPPPQWGASEVARLRTPKTSSPSSYSG